MRFKIKSIKISTRNVPLGIVEDKKLKIANVGTSILAEIEFENPPNKMTFVRHLNLGKDFDIDEPCYTYFENNDDSLVKQDIQIQCIKEALSEFIAKLESKNLFTID